MENVRRSLYDVGAWRARHLRLPAAGLRAAVGCEVSGWPHHVKGPQLPADGLTKQLMGPDCHDGMQEPASCSGKGDDSPVKRSFEVLWQSCMQWHCLQAELVDLVAVALGGPACKAGQTIVRAQNEPMAGQKKEQKRSDLTMSGNPSSHH